MDDCLRDCLHDSDLQSCKWLSASRPSLILWNDVLLWADAKAAVSTPVAGIIMSVHVCVCVCVCVLA